MINKVTVNGRTVYYSRFTSLAAARRFAYGDNAQSPMMVVMGDAPHFWVTTMADAARLERAGYELVA